MSLGGVLRSGSARGGATSARSAPGRLAGMSAVSSSRTCAPGRVADTAPGGGSGRSP